MKISITLDAADPALLARFWSAALGYVEASPPTGWSTWKIGFVSTMARNLNGMMALQSK